MHRGDDPLLAIPPAVYVERLLGVEVPRHRKVPCPFHPDTQSSLHVYDTPARLVLLRALPPRRHHLRPRRAALRLRRLFASAGGLRCPSASSLLDPSKLGKRFKNGLERAGLRQITFHELRHTFGTQLAAAGVPLRTIQEWMGHGDAKTTEVYRHYAPDPTHGADLVEGAFSQRSNPRSNVSETGGSPEDLKPLWNADSNPG